MNQRKKWCECCQIMIPYNRSAIQDHEGSHKHKRNHEKALRDAHMKARKEHKNFTKEADYFGDKSLLRKRPEKQKKEEKEVVPVADFVTSNEKVDAEEINDQVGFMGGKIWVLEKEDDTQRLRFRNTITGTINYERPVGLMLEDFEEEAWDVF